ncbi:class I SAM-dependent methyltransferase [Pseudonocardia endophytica]|uniref:2-polyprenyl-3-methyl-5-hydroxy-6-metoxy-1, 4-benzoquinol methylase n=1 Tax=Pseudonocardia endophytica TaxID=401976 RepID=A0A4R1HJP5_PSEEN|nr:methyltransferase domain-containing protein [Pseudonocardia endophytica]TCK22594.1 2-polyprenyl-3-methyl-5-hydroxy-6-metoxy-1,4-benzoquinol methylase [Pseudonocardia endophytica]
MTEPGRAFEDGVPGWLRNVERSRNTVRQRLVADQVAALVGGADALRVLDVGCGQGTQALALARRGHAVTGLDPSEELLERFAGDAEAAGVDVRLVRGPGEKAAELAPGPFDLVLCHGVLMYLDDPAPLLDALSAVAAPDARLSLLVRNGLAPAMRPGLRGESGAALEAFDRPDYTTRLGLAARMHTPSELDALLVPAGWRPLRWYGVRVFSDHRADPGPSELDDLVAAEAEAGARDPYRQVAALLHVQYRRPDRTIDR